jgi:hypothetical protein
MLRFGQDTILCVQEHLNFELGIIEGYGYEISRAHISPGSPDFPVAAEYCRASYSYKDTLAVTHPHHKHIPPNIKRHRVPAPELSFTNPNLPFLIQEVEQLLASG